MPQDRMTSEGSPPPSRRAQEAADSLAMATSSAGAQVMDAGKDAWERTQAAGAHGYDVARRATRTAGLPYMPLPALLVGAAIGYAAAYFIYSSGSPGRVGRAQPARSGSALVIATLNGLIEISEDGEQGFRASAASVQNLQTKALLNEAADSCARGASELQSKVRALGGNPDQSGSVSGSLHRTWLDLKSRIAGMDDGAILNEVERGEDVAMAAYANALKTGLPPEVRRLVERQYQGVRQNHDRVRTLRDAAR